MTKGNEAIKKLKLIQSRIAELEGRLPDPDDYGNDLDSYQAALAQVNQKFNLENKEWLLGVHKDKISGGGIGITLNKLKDQEKVMKKFLGNRYIGFGGLSKKEQQLLPNFMKKEFVQAKKAGLKEVGKQPLTIGGKKILGLSIGGKNKYFNPWYVYQFDEAQAAKNQKQYNQIEQDYLRGTDTTGMGSKEIDREIRYQLPRAHPLYLDPTGKQKTLNPVLNFNDSGVSTVAKTDSLSSEEKTGISVRKTLTGNSKFGDQYWSRGSGRTYSQANADTRALLIKETNNERAVNLLSNDQLSRFRISGARDSDKAVTLINDGKLTRIKKLSINQNY